MFLRRASGRALAAFALLPGLAACGVIPLPVGDQRDTDTLCAENEYGAVEQSVTVAVTP